MKNFQKGSIVLYIIILVALVLVYVGYYILSNTFRISSDAQSQNYPTVPTTQPAIVDTIQKTNTAIVTPPTTPVISDVLISSGQTNDVNVYKLSGNGFGKTSIVNITLTSSPFPNVVFPKYYKNIHPTSFTDSSLTFNFPTYSAGSSPGTYSIQVINSNSVGSTSVSNTKTFTITPSTGK